MWVREQAQKSFSDSHLQNHVIFKNYILISKDN